MRFLIPLSLVLALSAGAAAPAGAQDIADKLPLCAGCHGEAGVPTGPEIPVIWGQEFYYLYVQLKDYEAGRRANDIMQGIVADLSRDEMKALAEHFSKQKWPAIEHEMPSDEQTRLTNQFAAAGQCSACHLGGFNGNSRVPRLAGQTSSYLLKTMRDFRDGVRKNAPDMNNLMEGTPDAVLEAASVYIAAQ